MQILPGSAGITDPIGPHAVAIGIFDGVHLGHQQLMRTAVEQARQNNIRSLTYSFHPHPAQILRPDLAPKLLEPIDLRLQRIAAMGIDVALVEPFSREFAKTSPEDFVQRVLVQKLQARHVVVGEGFTFGRRQAGTVELLQQLGKVHGFEVHAIAPVRVDGIHVSSTKIREFVSEGKMDGAQLLLGHPYELVGSVVRGDGRGAKLGFPTANLEPQNEQLPGTGVYAAIASGPFQDHPAAVNVGYTPTFGGSALKIEAHLLDYRGGQLYGQTLHLAFIKKLRDEQKFQGVEQLTEQIQRDVAEARQVLSALD